MPIKRSPHSEVAHTNWGNLAGTGLRAAQIDKGARLRDTDERRGRARGDMLKKLRLDSRLDAQERLNEYNDIIDGVIDGRVNSAKAMRLVEEIWNDNQMYLLRGGFLGMERIEAVLNKMHEDKIISGDEMADLLADAREEKARVKQAETNMWDATVASEIVNNQATRTNADVVPINEAGNEDADKLAGDPNIARQIDDLLKEKWFRDESVKFLIKKFSRGKSTNEATAKANADDIYQNFVIKILTLKDQISKIGDLNNLRGYLKRVLVNTAIDFFRRNRDVLLTGVITDEEIARKLEAQTYDTKSELMKEARDVDTAREIIKYILGGENSVPEETFGHSAPILSDRGKDRMRKILIAKMQGKDTYQIAMELANTDVLFAEKYLDGITSPDPNNRDRKRACNTIDKLYERAKIMLRQELGIA